MRAAKRVGRYLRKAPVAWQGFRFHDPRPEELLCYTTVGRRNRRVSHCQAGESELFGAFTSGIELMDLGYNCSVTVAVRESLVTRDAVVTALRRNTLV